MTPSEASQQFVRSLHVPMVTGNASEIFEHREINAVLICSPTDTHAEYIIAAVRAGKHKFSEKPHDLDPNKLSTTLAAVDKAGVQLMTAFNKRLDPAFT